MKYSIKDIKESLPQYKSEIEPFWGRFFLRRFSYYVTYILINIGCSANLISLVSCFAAVIGSIIMCMNSWACIWIGVVLLNLWSVLDCVDGNIARCTQKSSLAGVFFDALGGYTASAFIMIGAGMAAYNTTSIFYNYRIYLLLLGSVGSICDILGRLIYQKYSICIIKMEYARIGGEGLKVENDESFNKSDSNSLLKRISMYVDYEFGIGGDEMLFLIIATIIKKIDIFLLLYSLYHICGFIIVFAMYAEKMLRYEKEYLR